MHGRSPIWRCAPGLPPPQVYANGPRYIKSNAQKADGILFRLFLFLMEITFSNIWNRSVRELDLGLGGPGREEMGTIHEAEYSDEVDSEFGEGARPSFFQSPLTATGNAFRRLLSRQESRSYSRPSVAIATSHKKKNK